MRQRVAHIILAIAILGVTACATINKFFDRPPIQVASDIVVAAEWGVEEAHSVEWLSDADYAQWRKIDATVRDVVAANPQTPRATAAAAVRAFMEHELAPDSRLRPYLAALLLALEAKTLPLE